MAVELLSDHNHNRDALLAQNEALDPTDVVGRGQLALHIETHHAGIAYAARSVGCSHTAGLFRSTNTWSKKRVRV